MGVTFTVLAGSEAEAVAWHRKLCDLLGLEPLGRPSQVLGRDRWMARAQVPAPQTQGGGEH